MPALSIEHCPRGHSCACSSRSWKLLGSAKSRLEAVQRGLTRRHPWLRPALGGPRANTVLPVSPSLRARGEKAFRSLLVFLSFSQRKVLIHAPPTIVMVCDLFCSVAVPPRACPLRVVRAAQLSSPDPVVNVPQCIPSLAAACTELNYFLMTLFLC